MSKSDPSETACLFLTDDADSIAFKIRKAKTDSISEVFYNAESRPEVANLLDIFAALTRQSGPELSKQYAGKQVSKLKSDLTDALVDHFAPIARRIEELNAQPDVVDQVLTEGADHAREIAHCTMDHLSQAIGLYRPSLQPRATS